MARPILVYGHPASGKSFAFKSLNPDTTIILDGDWWIPEGWYIFCRQ